MAKFAGNYFPVALPEPSKGEFRVWCECHAVFMTDKSDWKRHCDEGVMEYDQYWIFQCPMCGDIIDLRGMVMLIRIIRHLVMLVISLFDGFVIKTYLEIRCVECDKRLYGGKGCFRMG